MGHTNGRARGPSGVMALFDDSRALLAAAGKTREAGWKKWEVYSPYPVHGMDDAMGLKRSPLPYVTFIAGATGAIAGFAFQYWTSAIDWPLIVGGKPFNSWPAFVPVIFELTVLFAGLATAGAMILMNGLPNSSRKAYDPSLTRDRFAIVIEAPAEGGRALTGSPADGGGFTVASATDFLKKTGAAEVRPVFEEGWFS